MPDRPLICAIFFALLSGCLVDDAPAVPNPAEAVTQGAQVVAVVDSSDCAYNDMIWLVPQSEMQAHLPSGYVAADQGAGNTGLVINAIHCDDGFGWSGWTMFVTIDPPSMPDAVFEFDSANRTSRANVPTHRPLDLYLLTAHTDHDALKTVWSTFGLEHAAGSPSRERDRTPVGSQSVGTLHINGSAVASYAVDALQAPPDPGAHHRQWRQLDDGVGLVERMWQGDGGGEVALAIGPATCAIGEATLFAPFTQDRDCTIGQDILNGPSWMGRAYWFPGIQAEVAGMRAP